MILTLYQSFLITMINTNIYTYVAFHTCIVEKECTDAEFLTNVDEVEEINGRGEASSKSIFNYKMGFPSYFLNAIKKYIKQTL